MIVGLGSDVVNITRIEDTLNRFGSRFAERVFTENERHCGHPRLSTIAAHYAKRFAAKEACLKALGTGLADGIRWHDVEVIRLNSGKPSLKLHGNALIRLHSLMPAGFGMAMHVTLADDYPIAQAFVLIEAKLDRNLSG